MWETPNFASGEFPLNSMKADCETIELNTGFCIVRFDYRGFFRDDMWITWWDLPEIIFWTYDSGIVVMGRIGNL